jgi:hypothetical protein
MEMKRQILVGLAMASLLVLSAVPAAHADTFDQATRINFSAPVRVPGQVLPAGTYCFVLLNHGRDLNVVQIFNADRTSLIDTILTGHAERLHPNGRTELAFAEPGTAANPSGNIPALTKWFYPGDDVGHEFIYPKLTEREFQHESQVLVPVGSNSAVVIGG